MEVCQVLLCLLRQEFRQSLIIQFSLYLNSSYINLPFFDEPEKKLEEFKRSVCLIYGLLIFNLDSLKGNATLFLVLLIDYHYRLNPPQYCYQDIGIEPYLSDEND